jgi:Family of unknown function (DUF5677)
MSSTRAVFGNPAVWDSAFEAHEMQYRHIEELRSLVAGLVAATANSTENIVIILNSLTQNASQSVYDVVLLAGNGRSLGAMKIARRIFEILIIGTYLERNPSEVENYIDFGMIETWNRLQALERHHPGKAPTEVMTQAEVEYNRVKPKFVNDRGRVRRRWTQKTIRELAEAVGLLDKYETAYSLASDLHHVPLSGLIGAEMDWSREALYVAQAALLGTAFSLYNVQKDSSADFRSRLQMALNNLISSRKQS